VTDAVVVAAEGDIKQAETTVETKVEAKVEAAQTEVKTVEAEVKADAKAAEYFSHSEWERLKLRAKQNHTVVQIQHELAAFEAYWKHVIDAIRGF
jgi:hypothetical protein